MNSNIKVFKAPTGQYLLSGSCYMCKQPRVVTVQPMEFYNWQHGLHIQDAFPTLDTNEREFLVSGMCGKCFDKLFEDRKDD